MPQLFFFLKDRVRAFVVNEEEWANQADKKAASNQIRWLAALLHVLWQDYGAPGADHSHEEGCRDLFEVGAKEKHLKTDNSDW